MTLREFLGVPVLVLGPAGHIKSLRFLPGQKLRLKLEESSYYEHRCPDHKCVVSNGMFDTPCGGCEAELDRDPDIYPERWVHMPAEPVEDYLF